MKNLTLVGKRRRARQRRAKNLGRRPEKSLTPSFPTFIHSFIRKYCAPRAVHCPRRATQNMCCTERSLFARLLLSNFNADGLSVTWSLLTVIDEVTLKIWGTKKIH